ncbi:MAG: hypothetical protein ABSE84_00130 [Isosphaeraceae bacterium]
MTGASSPQLWCVGWRRCWTPGSATCGWGEDQCWTLAQIGEFIRGRYNTAGAVVAPQTVAAGQPHQAQHRPAHRAVEDRLKRMQYRPGLLDGFLASTGLDLTPM